MNCWKMYKWPIAFAALASMSFTSVPAFAQTLVFEGVLGNSGEQGPSLVRMVAAIDQHFTGMGVVHDHAGTLWDRGGPEVLNRYAPDGRLLGQYRIPKGYPPESPDLLTMVDDTLVLRLKKYKIFTLSVDAPSGSEVQPLRVQAKHLSFGSADGRLAAVDDEGLFLLRVRDGTVERWTPLDGRSVYHVEMTPDGAAYVQVQRVVRKFIAGREVTVGWPQSLTGERWNVGGRLQAMGTCWFAHTHSGTIARFNAALEPEPGVVLGGASGSFIGHLEGNYELYAGRGMARLGPDLYAVSGDGGVLHLLRWQPDKRQFAIVRRIGALPFCKGLALNRAGNIRCNCGCWRWNDLPDTPIRFSTGHVLSAPGVMLDDDRLVARTLLSDTRPELLAGPIDGFLAPGREDTQDPTLLKEPTGAVVYRRGKDQRFLVVNATGEGQAVRIKSDGKYQNMLGPVAFRTTSPVKQWTTLAMKDDKTLLAAADGRILELTADIEDWKEQRRWNSWGDKPDQKFGDEIFLTASDGRLWVSDTARHRVLCFQLPSGKPLGSFGQTDQPGDDLASLNRPESIAACGNRAVIFDSGNQRLIRLRLP
jgi:hypothetical protein